jgi:hypothetical protein
MAHPSPAPSRGQSGSSAGEPALSRFLAALRLHPCWGWAGLLAYAAAVTFPHEQVQYYVAELASQITHRRLYAASAALLLIQGALATWFLFKRLVGQPGFRRLAFFWILTFALICGTWRGLTANNTELVHYTQYFPEGVALAALTLSPVESVAWVALFGGLDEGFQYAVLMRGHKVPYDFNDIYMDLLGGAAGVLFALAFLRRQDRDAPLPWRVILRRRGVAVVLGVVCVGIALWGLGLMALYADPAQGHAWFALSRVKLPSFWFLDPANGPNRYHTLSPIEGPVLILTTILLFAALDRRLDIGTSKVHQ